MRVAEPLSVAQQVVVRWGQPGAGEVSALSLTPQEAEGLIGWSIGERLDGLLWAAVEGGGLEFCDEVVERLLDAHLSAQRTTVACEAATVEVLQLLMESGVDARVIKGLAAARLDYPDPSWRSSVDVDVIIDRADLRAATAALAGAGFERAEQRLADWWERRFARAVVFESPVGLEVDLHAAPVAGYFGVRLDGHALVGLRPQEYELAATTVRALPAPARLVTAAYALVLSRGTTVRYARDLAQVLEGGDRVWDEAVRLVLEADGQDVLARALDHGASIGVLSESHPAMAWARALPPPVGAPRRAFDLAAAGWQEGWAADARSTLLGLSLPARSLFIAGLLPRRARAFVRRAG